MPGEPPAFEEYRYDALGRRVLVRSRQHYACTTRCQSTVRRIVWDGDQVLAEIQAPGYSSTPAATMEQDVGFKAAAESTLVRDTSSVPLINTATYYPGYCFGRVLYTHGPGIDHPLSYHAAGEQGVAAASDHHLSTRKPEACMGPGPL
ncbi:MAG TPA: hypothetical protein VJY65_00845 [Chloroflexota bacterium]|nr:hypothetical protein [Chloroflexota bacterium]